MKRDRLPNLASCNSAKARQEMEKGKENYRKAQFEEAAKHFKAALDLDNDWVAAKFALAGTYASEAEPGDDTPETKRYAEQAIELFSKILERDPQNANALKDIGFMYMYIKRNDQAHEYFQKAVIAAPGDPDLFYLLGVIDWAIVYRDVFKRKGDQGLGMDDEFENGEKGRQLCKAIQADNRTRVDEGLAMLQKAIDKQQDYDDAMTYMFLLYRVKANMECDNQARLEELHLSHKWINESLAARKRKEANQKPNGNNPGTDDSLETGKNKISGPTTATAVVC